MDDSTHFNRLLERASRGDLAAFESLFDCFRDRLRRMVQLRLDRRLQGRIDASDVLQDAFLEATQRFESYSQNPSMPVFLWLRFLVAQRLTTLHRHHLGVQARDVSREVSLYSGPLPAASSAALAAQLIGGYTSPSIGRQAFEPSIGPVLDVRRRQKSFLRVSARDQGRFVLGHEPWLSQAAKCPQFDCAFCGHQLRSVDFTAVANADSFEQAVDATACRKKKAKLAAVAITSVISP